MACLIPLKIEEGQSFLLLRLAAAILGRAPRMPPRGEVPKIHIFFFLGKKYTSSSLVFNPPHPCNDQSTESIDHPAKLIPESSSLRGEKQVLER
jgi:hypothetical protein